MMFILYILSFLFFASCGKKQTIIPSEYVQIREDISENTYLNVKLYTEKRNLFVYIDSDGGSIYFAKKITDLFRKLNNTVCIAKNAYSAAFSIFQFCNERYVFSDSVLMQHPSHLNISVSLEVFQEYCENIDYFIEYDYALKRHSAKRIGLSFSDFQKKIKTEWWIVGGEQILHNHMADKVIHVLPTPS